MTTALLALSQVRLCSIRCLSFLKPEAWVRRRSGICWYRWTRGGSWRRHCIGIWRAWRISSRRRLADGMPAGPRSSPPARPRPIHPVSVLVLDPEHLPSIDVSYMIGSCREGALYRSRGSDRLQCNRVPMGCLQWCFRWRFAVYSAGHGSS
jgi:hypothetical protein